MSTRRRAKTPSILDGLLIALGLALLAALSLGWLAPLDSMLRDQRFRDSRVAGSDFVFVDIDAATLASVGVWPWPRSIHGSILDRLIADGAVDVLFDIDFSTSSSEAEDAAFEAALERAGGYAMLAAFRNGDSYNLPLPRFLQHAVPVTVNVGIDEDGIVRTYPYGLTLGGESIASAAVALTGAEWKPDALFLVDFSIDSTSISRISAAEVLAGTVPPGFFEGKQVIVGSSALELRDIFTTPVEPAVPGALVQLIAAETLTQGRTLTPLGPWPPAAAALLILLAAFVVRAPVRLPRALLGTASLAALAELAALLLQSRFAILLDTSALHIALVLFLLRAVGLELAIERFLRLGMSRERDATQTILDRVIEDNFDGVLIVDSDGKILTASRQAETILGRTLKDQRADAVLPSALGDAIAAQFSDSAGPAEPVSARIVVRGEERTLEFAATRSDVPTHGGDLRRVVTVTFRDVTERDAVARRLRYLADHDPMTGLLSRHRLVETIDDTLARPAGAMTVILIGIGRFKAVNATLGHVQGDLVLREVAKRLVGLNYSVARIGGTTFALAAAHAMSAGALGEACQDIALVLSEPYALAHGHRAIVTASVGGTTSDLSPGGAEVMLRHADMALAAAKARAGRHVDIFSPAMEDRVREVGKLHSALRDTVAEGGFSLVYQPKVAFGSRRITGAEVLVRWTHPVLGEVSPADFVPVAEETGLILELGRWVMREACREAMGWPANIRLAINVSPLQFELTDVLGQVIEALADARMPPHRLQIEITEGVLMNGSLEIAETLEAMRKLGITIALDDFGTGYSSLSYLRRLPVDEIKIDQSFVRGLPADYATLAVVDAIVRMGVSLGKELVAEGVETEEQAELLERMGCRTGQGYFFFRPLPNADLCALLARGTSARSA